MSLPLASPSLLPSLSSPYIFVDMLACMCTYMWRLEVDFGVFFIALHLVYIGTGSLT